MKGCAEDIICADAYKDFAFNLMRFSTTRTSEINMLVCLFYFPLFDKYIFYISIVSRPAKALQQKYICYGTY